MSILKSINAENAKMNATEPDSAAKGLLVNHGKRITKLPVKAIPQNNFPVSGRLNSISPPINEEVAATQAIIIRQRRGLTSSDPTKSTRNGRGEKAIKAPSNATPEMD